MPTGTVPWPAKLRPSFGHGPARTRALWERLRAEGAPRLPAGEVEAGEVARLYLLGAWSFRQSEPASGFVASEAHDRPGCPGGRQSAVTLGAAVGALSHVPAIIHPDARAVDPPALPPGTVAYMDPPYQNTTPYAHDLPRAEVVALARRWAAAGATVAISEAEPIPELTADGWHAVKITDCRRGQKRTFSRQQREYLTMNRTPVEAVGSVFDLFG